LAGENLLEARQAAALNLLHLGSQGNKDLSRVNLPKLCDQAADATASIGSPSTIIAARAASRLSLGFACLLSLLGSAFAAAVTACSTGAAALSLLLLLRRRFWCSRVLAVSSCWCALRLRLGCVDLPRAAAFCNPDARNPSEITHFNVSGSVS
jgi:hypothetical protein